MYKNSVNGNIFANIAKPIVEIKGEESLILTASKPKAVYSFEVRNFNEKEQINEVDMEYYLQIVTKANSLVKFKLLKDGEEVVIKENKTDNILIEKQQKKIHSYILEITYDSESEAIQEDVDETIEIKINSIQKI